MTENKLFLRVRRCFTVCMMVSLILFIADNAAESQEIDKLIEGAKKEGKVSYYVSMNQEDAMRMANAFQEKYPFIKVEMFLLSGENLLVKALAEARAGKFGADVYDSSLEQIAIMKQKGLLMKYYGPESKAIPEDYRDPEGFWTATYILPCVIAYNTKIVAPHDVPKTYEDLLDQKYKGKIGIESQQIDWFFNMLKIMGREKGLAFMKKLAQQDLMMRTGQTLLVQLCASGEIPIVAVGYLENVRKLQEKGASIDWVRLQSAPVVTLIHGISIVSTAPHPNAAKLFYNYSVSLDGAKVFRKMKRNPIRPEEQDPEVRKLKVHMSNSAELLANYDQVQREFREIFHKRN